MGLNKLNIKLLNNLVNEYGNYVTEIMSLSTNSWNIIRHKKMILPQFCPHSGALEAGDDLVMSHQWYVS